MLKAHWLALVLLVSFTAAAWALVRLPEPEPTIGYDVYPAPYSGQVREQVQRQEVLTKQLYRRLQAVRAAPR